MICRLKSCLSMIAAMVAVMAHAANFSFEIPAGDLSQALNRFAEQSRLQLIYPAELTQGLTTRGLKGEHAPLDGLRILLMGTGLVATITGENRATLERSPPLTAAATTHLPQVRVVEEVEEQDIYDQPRSISSISREDIDKVAPRHVSEVLQHMAGVYTVTNEQNPSVSVNVRGLKDFGRVNLNIDGVRQNYQLSGHQQRNGEMFVDSEMLAGVDVIKGPSSDLGGAGVLGGVANFRTIAIDDIVDEDRRYGARLRTSTGLGDLANGNRFIGSVAMGWRATEELDFLAAYSRKNLGEFEPGQHGQAFNYQSLAGDFKFPVHVVNLTGQDLDSELIKARWRPADRQELRFTALNTDVKFAQSSFIDADSAYNYFVYCAGLTEPSEFCQQLQFDPNNLYRESSRSSVRAGSFAVDYDFASGGRWLDARAKVYYADTRNKQIGGTATTPYRLTTQTETWGVNFENSSLFEAGPFDVNWKYGIEYFYDRTQPSADSTQLSGEALADLEGGTPRGNRWLGGAFTHVTFTYGDWLQVRPGLRFDRYSLWGNTGFTARDATTERQLVEYEDISIWNRAGKFSPTVTVAIAPQAWAQWFASYGEGWRPPSITEALIGGNHPGDTAVRYYPNYQLLPERSRTWEAGVNLKLDELLFAADLLRVKTAWFDSRIDHYMFFGGEIGIPGAPGPGLTRYMFVNSEDPVRFHGAEVDLHYDAGRWYLGTGFTRIFREGDFSYRPFPLGGASGPTPDYWNNHIYPRGGGLYNPAPPVDKVGVDTGAYLLNRQMLLGTRLTCATEGGFAYDGFSNQDDFCAWDLYGSYEVLNEFSLGLNLKNLRDRQYMMAMGDAYVRSYAPGRTLLLSAEWTF